jgi:signal transduction histidine kinase
MRHSELAAWLQEHRESLVALCEQGEAIDLTLIDTILETARTGRVDHLDSVIGQSAYRAVAQEIPLNRLLRKPQRVKEIMWEELKGDKLPPSQTLALIEAAEPIFSRIFQIAARSFFEANQQMQDVLASEIARLHTESERRVLDRTADLTRANVELSKLEQAKTDFISIAAHELKTPLTLIQGYTNMLHEMGMEGDGAAGSGFIVEGILRGADRLSAIVEDMLDVSVIDTDALSLRIEEVSLSHAVSLVVGQNAAYIGDRRLMIQVGDLGSLPRIQVDLRRLHQVLGHLLNNAIKYTPDGGEVFIEGHILPSDRGPTRDRQFVELIIRDTGIGIAPEDRERIFEKFYRVGKSTLHSSGKVKFMGAGPGLGLPIARGLAEAHGGRLWAESPGHDEINCPGSTFHLLLPVRAIPKPGITVTWVESPSLGEGEEKEEAS